MIPRNVCEQFLFGQNPVIDPRVGQHPVDFSQNRLQRGLSEGKYGGFQCETG
jgi:hypothetical protein